MALESPEQGTKTIELEVWPIFVTLLPIKHVTCVQEIGRIQRASLRDVFQAAFNSVSSRDNHLSGPVIETPCARVHVPEIHCVGSKCAIPEPAVIVCRVGGTGDVSAVLGLSGFDNGNTLGNEAFIHVSSFLSRDTGCGFNGNHAPALQSRQSSVQPGSSTTLDQVIGQLAWPSFVAL